MATPTPELAVGSPQLAVKTDHSTYGDVAVSSQVAEMRCDVMPQQKLGKTSGLEWVVLSVATLIAAILRFYHLGEPSLWIDEGFSLVHAQSILAHGYPLLPTGEVSWSYFPVHYLIALGLQLSDSLAWGGRLFPALCGMLLVPATFLLGKRAFRSTPIALVACLLVAISSYEVAWSRQARVYVCLQLFSTVAVWAFYRFLDTRRTGALIGAWLACGLAVSTHRAGYLVPTIFALALLCETGDARAWWRWAVEKRYLLIMLAVASASFVATLGALASNSGTGSTVEQALTPTGWQHGPKYAVVLWRELGLVAVWGLAGAALACTRHWRRGLPLVLTAGLYIWSISTRSLLFHFRYILPVIPILLLLAACAGVTPARALLRRSGFGAKVMGVIILCGFLGSTLTGRFSPLPRTHYALGFTAPQPNWQAAYRWISDEAASAVGPTAAVKTISTFPMFHDLYLGTDEGERFFLPFSRTGYPGEYQDSARYSKATVIGHPLELWTHGAWIVLDDFGLRMLKDHTIRDELMNVAPTHIVRGPHPFDVFVWAPLPRFRAD